MGNFKTNGCVGALMKTLFTKLPRIVNVDKNINNIGKCVSLSNKGEAVLKQFWDINLHINWLFLS